MKQWLDGYDALLLLLAAVAAGVIVVALDLGGDEHAFAEIMLGLFAVASFVRHAVHGESAAEVRAASNDPVIARAKLAMFGASFVLLAGLGLAVVPLLAPDPPKCETRGVQEAEAELVARTCTVAGKPAQGLACRTPQDDAWIARRDACRQQVVDSGRFQHGCLAGGVVLGGLGLVGFGKARRRFYGLIRGA